MIGNEVLAYILLSGAIGVAIGLIIARPSGGGENRAREKGEKPAEPVPHKKPVQLGLDKRIMQGMIKTLASALDQGEVYLTSKECAPSPVAVTADGKLVCAAESEENGGVELEYEEGA